MALGILEAHGHDHVPGTTRYFDDPSRPQIASAEHARAGLKVDNSGKDPIILVRTVLTIDVVYQVSLLDISFCLANPFLDSPTFR